MPKLLDEIKARMFQAIKSGNVVEKEILRVAVGEITTEAARPGRLGNDEEALSILRKLVKSNEESLAESQDETRNAQLRQENAIIAAFLPTSLSVDEITEKLSPVAEAIRAAGNEGQATGIAMKHLKPLGVNVNGKDVSAAVKRVRG